MKKEFRQHIEEIVTLNDDDFERIASYFAARRYNKGDFLFRQGDRVYYMYFVVSGLLKLVYNDESGKEHILSFAMEDWWETDYWAYYNRSTASMSLQCLEDSDILCITLSDYQELCADHPKMVSFFLQKATSGHIASQQRILSLLRASAQERYEALLRRYPSLFQRVSKSLIAAYLGVSRETLSRFLPNFGENAKL